MNEINQKILHFSNISLDLVEVEYKLNEEVKSDSNVSINVEAFDELKVLNLDNEGFQILYVRKVALNPIKLFSIKVAYKIDYKFDEKTIKEYEDNYGDLEKLVDEKAYKSLALSRVCSRASAMISAITMQNNGNALITPPIFITNKAK